MITGLITAFTTNVAGDPRISADVQQQVEVRIASGAGFAPADEVRAGATSAGIDQKTTDALISSYEDAQLSALKIGFLGAALLTLATFFATARLPTRRFDELAAEATPGPSRAPPSAA